MSTLDEGVIWCEQRMLDAFVDVGLTAAPPSVIDAMRRRFGPVADEVDWLDLLNPTKAAPTSDQFTIFMSYLERIEFQPGAILAVQGDPVVSIAFLEEGRAAYASVDVHGAEIEGGVLDAGTFFGVHATYAGVPYARTVTALTDGYYYCLPSAELTRMEEAHPALAIALHRELATRLGQRADRAEELVRSLQQ